MCELPGATQDDGDVISVWRPESKIQVLAGPVPLRQPLSFLVACRQSWAFLGL